MRRISRAKLYFVYGVIALGLLAVVGWPLGASALSASDRAANVFCANLDAKAAVVQTRYQDLRSKVTTAWTNQDTKLQDLADQRNNRVEAARQRIDDQRQLNFAKLEDKASSDAQKSAVTAYETAITSAATTRRAAVDVARTAFRDGAVAAVQARRTTLTNQASSLNTAIGVAFSTAATSCNGGVDTATVRATLLASLKASHESFLGQRKADGDIRSQVAALAETRRAVVKTANDAFTVAASDAVTALRTAFGRNV